MRQKNWMWFSVAGGFATYLLIVPGAWFGSSGSGLSAEMSTREGEPWIATSPYMHIAMSFYGGPGKLRVATGPYMDPNGFKNKTA